MIQQSLTIVHLSPIQAERFVQFQKYYPKIDEMIREGFFDIKGGRGMVDFKDDGSIDRIIKITYSKKGSVLDTEF